MAKNNFYPSITNYQIVGSSIPTIEKGRQYDIGDLSSIFNGQGTYPENLIEYAGRVCYRSTANMGKQPDFIEIRIREGHFDILEHGWLSMAADIPYPYEFFKKCKYLSADPINDAQWLISGNFRAWLECFSHDSGVMGECALVAPSIFRKKIDAPIGYDAVPIASRQIGQAKVAMLAVHKPTIAYNMRNTEDHCAATFMIEGVSRTFSHQDVRHRLSSVSQESQRYVDLEKGGWSAVVPPSIAGNPDALQIMSDFWAIAEEKYAALRDLGIRKEDARFILPNAAETRLVQTMPLRGWEHFLKLRLPKAAQWEIRNVAMMIRDMLLEAGFDLIVQEEN